MKAIRSSRMITMAALSAAEHVTNSLGLNQNPVDTAIISGKGWRLLSRRDYINYALISSGLPRRKQLNSIGCFTDIEDEFRRIALIETKEQRAVALLKPLYLHEAPNEKWLRMMRMQIEMMALIGARHHSTADGELIIEPAIKRMIFLDNGSDVQPCAYPTLTIARSFDVVELARQPNTASDHFVLDSVINNSLMDLAFDPFTCSRLAVGQGKIKHIAGPIMPHGEASQDHLQSIGADVVCMGLLPWMSCIGQYRHDIDCLGVVMTLAHVGELIEPCEFSKRAKCIRQSTTAWLRQLLLHLPHS